MSKFSQKMPRQYHFTICYNLCQYCRLVKSFTFLFHFILLLFDSLFLVVFLTDFIPEFAQKLQKRDKVGQRAILGFVWIKHPKNDFSKFLGRVFYAPGRKIYNYGF